MQSVQAINSHPSIDAALACEQDAELTAQRKRADDNARVATLLQRVVRTSRALIDAPDFEAALHTWLGHIADTTTAMRASYYDIVLHEPTGLRTVRVLCEWQRAGVQGSLRVSFAQPHVLDPRGAEEAMAQLTSGRMFATQTEDLDPPMRDEQQAQGNATVIIVPIFLDEAQIGCLSFDYAVRRELDFVDSSVLQTAADTLSAVLNRNRAASAALAEREARIVAEQSRFSELVRANDAMRTSLDAMSDEAGEAGEARFCRQTLLEIRSQAGAQSVYLLGCDTQGGVLRVLARNVRGQHQLQEPVDDPPLNEHGLTLDARWLEQIKPRGKRWHGEDTVDAGDHNTLHVLRWRERAGYSAHSVHGLLIGQRVVGLICALYDNYQPLTPARLELLHALCQPLTLALELARQARLARTAAEDMAALAERERIAGEIHDSLAQSFTSIAMQSESLADRFGADTSHARVLRLIEYTARQGLAEARAAVLALHAVNDDVGALDRALAELAERCNVEGRFRCHFESSGRPSALSLPVRESLLRVAREASSNALRHSGGSEIALRLVYASPCVRLTVSDNGHGRAEDIDALQEMGFGMSGMKSRATAIGGSFTLRRSALGGLAVSVACQCLTDESGGP